MFCTGAVEILVFDYEYERKRIWWHVLHHQPLQCQKFLFCLCIKWEVVNSSKFELLILVCTSPIRLYCYTDVMLSLGPSKHSRVRCWSWSMQCSLVYMSWCCNCGAVMHLLSDTVDSSISSLAACIIDTPSGWSSTGPTCGRSGPRWSPVNFTTTRLTTRTYPFGYTCLPFSCLTVVLFVVDVLTLNVVLTWCLLVFTWLFNLVCVCVHLRCMPKITESLGLKHV